MHLACSRSANRIFPDFPGRSAPRCRSQVFWCLSYVMEPFSLAAQSLLARDRYCRQRAAAWARLLLKAGSGLGVVLAGALVIIYQVGRGGVLWVCWAVRGNVQRTPQPCAIVLC